MAAKRDSYAEFVLEQLAGVGEVDCRPMFGAHGLYLNGAFFGIIAGGRLYFKTNQATAAEYRERGMQQFRPSEHQMLKNYYEVPAEVVEDGEELARWAWRAAEA